MEQLATAYGSFKPKFHPYCVGHPACRSPKAAQAFQAFHAFCASILAGNPHNDAVIKGNIVDMGPFIAKVPRGDISTTSDTHLYRVRKAEKIRRFIAQNGLDAHFVVPEKFLLRRQDGAFIVLAEKLQLSNDVVQVHSEEVIAGIRKNQNPEGQVKRFLEGYPQKPLTMEQVKGLAKLAFLGLTDQTYNNFFFTPEGKIAILDTEPVHRAIKKKWQASSVIKYLQTYNSACIIQRSFYATSTLKLVCSPAQIMEVEKLERRECMKEMVKSIARVALCVLAFYAIPILLPYAALPVLAASYIQFTIRTALVLKTISHILQTLSVYVTYYHSRNGVVGHNALAGLIRNGHI